MSLYDDLKKRLYNTVRPTSDEAPNSVAEYGFGTVERRKRNINGVNGYYYTNKETGETYPKLPDDSRNRKINRIGNPDINEDDLMTNIVLEDIWTKNCKNDNESRMRRGQGRNEKEYDEDDFNNDYEYAKFVSKYGPDVTPDSSKLKLNSRDKAYYTDIFEKAPANKGSYPINISHKDRRVRMPFCDTWYNMGRKGDIEKREQEKPYSKGAYGIDEPFGFEIGRGGRKSKKNRKSGKKNKGKYKGKSKKNIRN